ncbi:hypothetical protein TYRP_011402 [Tyrophagus putrescentiae]|nr:hypothetical protein TYRP_011402 [Tyrophagus putrescentiae]
MTFPRRSKPWSMRWSSSRSRARATWPATARLLSREAEIAFISVFTSSIETVRAAAKSAAIARLRPPQHLLKALLSFSLKSTGKLWNIFLEAVQQSFHVLSQLLGYFFSRRYHLAGEEGLELLKIGGQLCLTIEGSTTDQVGVLLGVSDHHLQLCFSSFFSLFQQALKLFFGFIQLIQQLKMKAFEGVGAVSPVLGGVRRKIDPFFVKKFCVLPSEGGQLLKTVIQNLLQHRPVLAVDEEVVGAFKKERALLELLLLQPPVPLLQLSFDGRWECIVELRREGVTGISGRVLVVRGRPATVLQQQ